MNKIGFVGIGKMGSSILNGIIQNKLFSKSDILLFDVNTNILDEREQEGYKIAQSEVDVFTNCQYVILAIKPQSFPSLVCKTKDLSFNCIVVSIAAGISINYLMTNFKFKNYIRVMPNTPVLIGYGATAITKGTNISEFDFCEIKKIFSAVGICEEIPEEQMDAIIPCNGSMPAYLYLFAQSFIEEAVNNGIDYETAKKLTCEAIIGSAKMIMNTNKTIDELINDVCSPKGTTLAGLEILNNNNFKELLKKASHACTIRSKELNNN